MPKKILFLGRTTAPFTTRRDIGYIIDNLVKQGAQVHLYDPKEKFLFDFNDRSTKSYNLFPKFLFFSPLYLILNFLVLIRFCIQNRNAYDVVQVNYVREEYLLVPRLIKSLGEKLLVLVYGSDVNLRNFVKNNFKKLYSISERIIVTNHDFGEKLKAHFLPAKAKEKVRTIFLPQDQFDLYEEKTMEYKLASKRLLGLSEEKKVVIIGTNSSENEQHEALIENLQLLKNIDDYQFIFMLTNAFGRWGERELRIEQLIKTSLKNIDTRIVNGFLSYEEMRDYRFASDVFVNMRKNDQLAASMLESILALNTVITGSWLQYEELQKNVRMELVNDIADLLYVLQKNDLEESVLIQNREYVLLHYGSEILHSWIELYRS